MNKEKINLNISLNCLSDGTIKCSAMVNGYLAVKDYKDMSPEQARGYFGRYCQRFA